MAEKLKILGLTILVLAGVIGLFIFAIEFSKIFWLLLLVGFSFIVALIIYNEIYGLEGE